MCQGCAAVCNKKGFGFSPVSRKNETVTPSFIQHSNALLFCCVLLQIMSSTTSSISSGDDSTSKSSRKRSAEKSGFRKAPGAPKRFKSPYILFSISRMEGYRKEMGSKTKVTSISKLVSDEWKALPTEERKKWEERARLDKERYNAEKSLCKCDECVIKCERRVCGLLHAKDANPLC